MKKRIIALGLIVVLLSVTTLFTTSILSTIKDNKITTKEEITSYLSIALNNYDGTNHLEVSNVLVEANSKIRVTFIDLNGNVIYDTLHDNESMMENHLSRDEIKHLGQIFIRDSKTFGIKMMYIADLSNNTYIRVSLEMVIFTPNLINYIVLGIITIIIIMLLSTLLMNVLSKKIIRPINDSINTLEMILNNNDSELRIKTVDDLPKIVNLIKKELERKIIQIEDEVAKNEALLKEMQQGLILLSDNNINIINNQALNVFKVSKEKIINKSYLYLIRDKELQDLIETCINFKKSSSKTLEINNRYYYFIIRSFNYNWIKCGTLITFIDITEKQKIEQMKKDFFANASHELKSPLTSIIGYQQMINNGIISDKEEINKASSQILKEANRMNQIIIDMLELSNLEYKKDYAMEFLDIAMILNDIILRYDNKIKDKNITVKKNITHCYLNANKEQIETLFSNLIDNAIKYNKINGSIEIILNEEMFVIKDSGIGISNSDQERVFERFYRVDKAKSKLIGGTGLGLAIVKHICEKFNYKVRLDSILDVGTQIKIIFKC